jgi:hypothetical protein
MLNPPKEDRKEENGLKRREVETMWPWWPTGVTSQVTPQPARPLTPHGRLVGTGAGTAASRDRTVGRRNRGNCAENGTSVGAGVASVQPTVTLRSLQGRPSQSSG